MNRRLLLASIAALPATRVIAQSTSPRSSRGMIKEHLTLLADLDKAA